MRQLRRQQHPAVEEGRDRTLPVQRLRTLPQDQRRQPPAREAEQTAGQSRALLILKLSVCEQVLTRSCSRASIRTAPCSAG